MLIINIKIYIKTVIDYFQEYNFHFMKLKVVYHLFRGGINMRNWRQLMKYPNELYHLILFNSINFVLCSLISFIIPLKPIPFLETKFVTFPIHFNYNLNLIFILVQMYQF